MERCINIDWLECYCIESGKNFPHDAQYYRDQGYLVRERDYGTRQYNEVFTVCDEHDQAFVEIRRNPVSGSMASRVKGIFTPYSCHIKLANRYCYHERAIDIYTDFLYKHGYSVQRLYRFDICCDFSKFDDNTMPNDFVKRYLSGKFSKINQCNIASHGQDRWEGRVWNSLAWGSPTSMVGTKLYCKSLELKQVKDKPYIRYAWFKAGLVDNYITLAKIVDTKVTYPDIWRLEFSIKSSAKGYYRLEDNTGKKTKYEFVEHCLDTYDSRDKLLIAFSSLVHHYFHFKVYQEGVRKDRCADRVLFNFGSLPVYHLDRLLTDKPKDKSIDALKKRIERYRHTQVDPNVRKACDIILDQLSSQQVRDLQVTYNRSEAQLLQQLIARRMTNPDEPFNHSIDVVRALLDLNDSIF